VASFLVGGAQPWAVAADPRIGGGRLTGAETLETQFIIPAISQFNNRRINLALQRRDRDGNVAVDNAGLSRLVEGKRLLKPLFATTEYNIASSITKSNMHPFPALSNRGPDVPVEIPDTFFLNANLISGGTVAGYRGLRIRESQSFRETAKVEPAEYRDLVQRSGLRLGGRAGDTGFAWFVPEPSHVDNSMIDRLMARGVITAEFVAAALGVDLENPILSEKRASLLRFVPDSFRSRLLGPGEEPPADRHPDDLTRQVIEAIRAEAPPAGLPEAEFLRRLEAHDPVQLLRQDISVYRDRLRVRLEDPEDRPGELRRLFDLANARRRAVIRDEILRDLDETRGLLFPSP
jgi:hypothetical protein